MNQEKKKCPWTNHKEYVAMFKELPATHSNIGCHAAGCPIKRNTCGYFGRSEDCLLFGGYDHVEQIVLCGHGMPWQKWKEETKSEANP